MNLISSLSGEYAVVAFPCFSDEEMGVQEGRALSRASQFPALTLSLPRIRFTLSFSLCWFPSMQDTLFRAEKSDIGQ